MNPQLEFQKVLAEYFANRRIENSKFSLRDLAAELQSSHASLSGILKGRRRVSKKMAQALMTRMEIDPDLMVKTLAHFERRDEVSRTEKPEERVIQQLTIDEFSLIGEWYHSAIVALSEIRDFVGTPEWIAERLGLQLRETTDACARLERLGILQKDTKGMLKGTDVTYETTDQRINLALRRSNIQSLRMGIHSLRHDPLERRAFYSSTFAANPEKIPEAKEMIRGFRKELKKLLQSGEKTDVFRLNFQLMPFTKGQ